MQILLDIHDRLATATQLQLLQSLLLSHRLPFSPLMKKHELETKKISESYDEYLKEIESASNSSIKRTVDLMISNNDSKECFFSLLHVLIKKVANSELSPETFLKRLLEELETIEGSEQILYNLLNGLKDGRKDEECRFMILDAIGKLEISIPVLVDLLNKPDTHGTIRRILLLQEDRINMFLRAAFAEENQIATKNLSCLIPRLPASHFTNYHQFSFLFEKECYAMRTCFLEVIEGLILHFKGQNSLAPIKELLDWVENCLCDTNYFVRLKALNTLFNLFTKESILKEQRNGIIKSIIERIKDKTVLVRKKAINIMYQILINNPFKDKKVLNSSCGAGKACDDASGKAMPRYDAGNMELKSGGGSDFSNKMAEDYKEFVALIEEALENVMNLFNYDLKTDLQEMVQYIQAAYLYKVDGSLEAIRNILKYVYGTHRELIAELIKSIFAKSSEILYDFIGDESFGEILRSLNVNTSILFKNFYLGERAYESVYILKYAVREMSEEEGTTFLVRVTEIFFSSADEAALIKNIEMYCNALSILQSIRPRIPSGSPLIKLVIKNLIKMRFFESSVIKSTVELIYRVSHNPEKDCGRLLDKLCLVGSKIKMLDAVGWIVLSQCNLLERVEKKFRGAESTGQMRKSMEACGVKGIREHRKSIEDGRRFSVEPSRAMSLKLDNLQESMKDKTEEEIADFFFYLKEYELLYSKSSLLPQFLPLIKEALSSSFPPSGNESFSQVSDYSNSPALAVVAFSTLNKLMLVSSVYFKENFPLFLASLKHPILAVRNNAVITLHDFVFQYNTSVDPSILFSLLDDPSLRMNVVLVLYILLSKNVIRIQNNVHKLMSYFWDEEIGVIIRTMMVEFSGNNNLISVVLYEVFLSSLDLKILRSLAVLINDNIKEALFLKLLKSGDSIERMKCVFDAFGLEEKFVESHLFVKNMREVSEMKT